MYSEDILNFLKQHLGVVPVLVLMFLLLLVPGILAITFIFFLMRSKSRCYFGLLLGLGLGVWASLCWLLIPYMGAYPNLPGLLLMLIFTSSPVDTLAEELFVHAVNFTLWPMAGWAVFRAKVAIFHTDLTDAVVQQQDDFPHV